MGQDAVGKYPGATRLHGWPARPKCNRATAPGVRTMAGEMVAEASCRQSWPDLFHQSDCANRRHRSCHLAVGLRSEDCAGVVFRTLTKREDRKRTRRADRFRRTTRT